MNESTIGAVIVTGVPGAGKSTIAHALAARAHLGAHLDIDAIYDLIVGGRIAFHQDSPDEDWWQLTLARTHIGFLATSFASYGVLPIIDDVVTSRSELDNYLAILPTPIRLVVLAPSIDSVLARDAARHKQVAAQWAYLAEPIAKELSGLGLWLDTSHLEVDSTVAAIEARWDEALLRSFQ